MTTQELAAKLRDVDLTLLDWHTFAIIATCGPLPSESLTRLRTGVMDSAVISSAQTYTWRALERLRGYGLIELSKSGCWQVAE